MLEQFSEKETPRGWYQLGMGSFCSEGERWSNNWRLDLGVKMDRLLVNSLVPISVFDKGKGH